jgi:hypothetical protein
LEARIGVQPCCALHALHAAQLRSERAALATAATAPEEGADRAESHAALQRHTAAAATLRSALEEDLRAVESFRPRVFDAVRGVEDAARTLRLNAVRRDMALAQARPRSHSRAVQERCMHLAPCSHGDAS